MWLFPKRRVYLDHASAPPVLPEAVRAMREAEELVGNPGAIHAEAVAAKKSLENSREHIALLIGCKARELIFTDGLTEANNIAVLGSARKLELQGRTLNGTHWLVSSIEHDSVLHCFGEVERMGGTVTCVEPDERGIVLPEAVAAALKPETVFVSIGWANNEIGTVQPLASIARVIREHERPTSLTCGLPIVFHTDGGQAPLYVSTVVQSLGVDLVSLGANKLYGPHGVGALIIRNRVELSSVLFGGKQEHGARPGTENVALAAGFAAAFEKIVGERDAEARRVEKLRGQLASELALQVPGLVVNGDLKHALPHMLNVSIPNISSEYLTLSLDHAGIAVSTKSACREGEESRSHVVEALKGEDWRARNTIRMSLGRDTDASDIARTVEAFVRFASPKKG